MHFLGEKDELLVGRSKRRAAHSIAIRIADPQDSQTDESAQAQPCQLTSTPRCHAIINSLYTLYQRSGWSEPLRKGLHDALVARSSSSLQGPGFHSFAFRRRTKWDCNRLKAPLRPARGFRRARVTPSWLHPFEDLLQVLLLLGLINQAITLQFLGLAEIILRVHL